MSTVGTSKFRLWKLDNQTKSFDDLFNDIKIQYETTRTVTIDGEQIEYSAENVMTLNLKTDSLLIVEGLPLDRQEFAFRTTLNADVELEDKRLKTGSKEDENIELIKPRKLMGDLPVEEEKVKTYEIGNTLSQSGIHGEYNRNKCIEKDYQITNFATIGINHYYEENKSKTSKVASSSIYLNKKVSIL